jgi:subtilase family serine protease
MRILSSIRRPAFAMAFASIFVLTAMGVSLADSGSRTARPLVIQKINDKAPAVLNGNVRKDLAAHRNLGPVDDSLKLNHLFLTLRRSPEQQAALTNLIERLHQPSAPEYHQWLTPEQFGQSFGVSDKDIAAITVWLESRGFHVNNVPHNAVFIDFAGTAKNIRDTFHTQLTYFDVNGQKRFANTGDPQIPAALQDVVAGITGLNNFPLHANHSAPQQVSNENGKWHNASAHTGANPAYSNGSGDYDIAPQDFYTIYNTNSLYAAGTKGAGATIAVAEESDIEFGTVNSSTHQATGGDVATFRSLFGVNAVSGTLNMYVYHGYGADTCTAPGIDPSDIGEDVEASLDAEWASAVAPAAKLIFMSCDDNTDNGIFTSLQALFDNNLADAVSLSYGETEIAMATSDFSYLDGLWTEAAAQGQSVLISSGDSGSDVADQNTNAAATSGINVSGFSASPYVTATGGTDFQDYVDSQFGGLPQSTYWNSGNTSAYGSAKSYAPETTWDSSCAGSLTALIGGAASPAAYCGEGPSDAPIDGYVIGGSGGYSSHYPLPSYQSGITGLSSKATMRAQPDISMFASSGWWGHILLFCDSHYDVNPNYSCSSAANFGAAGGTSFVAPQMAGVAGLLVSYTGQRQGVLNYGIYALAKAQFTASATKSACYANGQTANTGITTSLPNSACIFRDVTTGNNDVPCAAGAEDCYVSSGNSYGLLSTTGSTSLTVAYPAGTGYDLATGIGSINIDNLITKWSTAFTTSTTLTAAPTSITTSGSTKLTATVTASVPNGTASADPAGTITFFSGTKSIGTCTLASGSCSATIAASTLGGAATYSLTATYGASKNYPTSTSTVVSVTVTGSSTASTTTKLTVSPSDSFTAGTTASLKATVTASSGTATGSVAFSVAGTTIGSCSLSSGSCTLTESTANLAAGTYPLVATYAGATGFTGSASSTVNVTLEKATSTTKLTVATNPITPPASDTLTATVTTAGGTPSGKVTFTVGSFVIGSATVSGGTAKLTASSAGLTAGTYPVTATYSGNTYAGSSTSSAVNVVVK